MRLNDLKPLVKRNRFIYWMYYHMMSLWVNVMRLFVKTDDKLILFVSFGGRRFTDSPRAIYEAMRKDSRFAGYRLTWAFIDPTRYPQIENRIRIDSFNYYKTALKARCWITNVLVERALNFSGKHTFYLYTDHGGPIKKCGIDLNNLSFSSLSKYRYDASIAQSEFDRAIRANQYQMDENKVFLTGMPKNDILCQYSDKKRKAFRSSLGIQDDQKKVVLYAPTFREYRYVGTFDSPKTDFHKWHDFLGEDYVILYRAHPIANKISIVHEDWLIDVSPYECIEPLLIASDMLVSDYSGLLPDYSILHKPIYLYLYDYEQYNSTRGLYIDLKNELPSAENEEDLLKMIKQGETKEQKEKVLRFQKKYASVYGGASAKVADLIYNSLCL